MPTQEGNTSEYSSSIINIIQLLAHSSSSIESVIQPLAYHFQNIEVQNEDAPYNIKLDIQQNKVLSELYNLKGQQLQRVIKMPDQIENSNLFMSKLVYLKT